MDDHDGGEDDTGGDAAEWAFTGGDQDETAAGSRAFQSQKNALILVVDVRDAMFKPRMVVSSSKSNDATTTTTTTTDFSIAMDFCRLYLRQQIVSGSKDMVMILAMGSGISKNSNGYPDLYEFTSFSQSDAQTMKELYVLSRSDEKSITQAKTLFGVKSDDPNIDPLTSLEHTFWYCSTKFQEKKLKPSDTQRVFILTNDRDPSRARGEEICRKTFQRVRDLGEAGRVVTLWPLRPESEFPLDMFWKRLLTEHVKSRRTAVARTLAFETSSSSASQSVMSTFSTSLPTMSMADSVLDQRSSLEEDVENRTCFDASTGALDALFDGIKKKIHIKRRLYTVPMFLGSGVEMATTWYMTVKEAVAPSAKPIDAQTGQMLKSETRYLCEGTVDYMTPDQIATSVQFGSTGIPFSKAEQMEVGRFNVSPVSVTQPGSVQEEGAGSGGSHHAIKTQDPTRYGLPGFLILGFKPQSEFPLSLSMGPSYFMRPDELTVVGSTKLFNALLAETSEAGLVILGACQSTMRGAPRLMAAFPQSEVVDSNGDVVQPGGFYVSKLPYMDDIRKARLDEPFSVRAAEESQVVDAAKDVIRALSSHYDPNNFENPALQKFYTNLEALAKIYSAEQSAEAWDSNKDTLQPPDEEFTFNEAFSGPLFKFNEAYGGLDTELEEKKKKPTKRAAASESAAAAAADSEDDSAKPAKTKRARPDAMSNEDMKNLASAGKLNTLTLDVLKAFLREKGVMVGGKKADLVIRIEDFFSFGGDSFEATLDE